MGKAPFSEAEFLDELDMAAPLGEAGYTTLERKSIRPTLDVNGIWGGYTGEGAKTVIASEAHAKISMRLVPDQNPDEIAQLFEKHFRALAPPSVKVTVAAHHGGWPAVTPTDSYAYKAAYKAFEQAWGKAPIPMREGGSIPIVALFEKVLGLKTVLLGFGLDSDAIHSPNEHYGVFNFLKGIETIAAFHRNFGASS
jgi:acetylornithine deacetylase/succinyl-diaminopimelate desuccinylase-like protein